MCGSSKKWRENHIPSSALSSLSQWKVHFLGHTTCSNTSMLEGPLAADPYQNGLTQVPGSGLEVCHSQKISSWPVGWWWPRFTMIRHEGSSYNMLSWLDLFLFVAIEFFGSLNRFIHIPFKSVFLSVWVYITKVVGISRWEPLKLSGHSFGSTCSCWGMGRGHRWKVYQQTWA